MEKWEVKYRPTSFDEVVGQGVNAKILQSTLNDPYHTMIFQGSSGCGKTTCARIYGTMLNANIIEVDAASNNGVDNMREILELVRLQPLTNKHRVIIVDECIHGSETLWCKRPDGKVEPIRMNKLVKNREDVKVLAIDNSGNLCWTDILEYHKNGKKDFRQYNFKVKGTNDTRRIVCTPNHLIRMKDGTYIQASMLKCGDEILGARKNRLDVGKLKKNVYLKREHSYDIPNQALEIIHGTLLGDSSLSVAYDLDKVSGTTPRLICSFGASQIGYRIEMARILGDVLSRWEDPTPAVGEKAFQNSVVGRFTTHCDKLFLPFYRELYSTGHKKVTKEYLDALTDLGLAVWFMDDGSCGRKDGKPLKSPIVSLHTEGYSLSEVELISKFFHDRYNWNACITHDDRLDSDIGFVLSFNVSDSKKFLEVVAPYVTHDLEYKLAGYIECGDLLSKVKPIRHFVNIDKSRLDAATIDFEFEEEVLEFVGDSDLNACARTYSNYSYDLTTSTGNYFVGNVAVHNCHMLSQGAWNSALKAIEEPNSSTIWIFCTTEFNKVPNTIRGRAVTFKFYPVKEEVLIQRMKVILEKENQTLNDQVLSLIASNSNGQVRDAVKNLQQCVYAGVETEEQFNKLFGIPDTDGMRAYIESTLSHEPANGIKVIKKLDVDFYDWKCRLETLLQDMMYYLFGIQELKAKTPQQAQKLNELAHSYSPRVYGLFLDKLARITDARDARTRLITLCLMGVD